MSRLVSVFRDKFKVEINKLPIKDGLKKYDLGDIEALAVDKTLIITTGAVYPGDFGHAVLFRGFRMKGDVKEYLVDDPGQFNSEWISQKTFLKGSPAKGYRPWSARIPVYMLADPMK